MLDHKRIQEGTNKDFHHHIYNKIRKKSSYNYSSHFYSWTHVVTGIENYLLLPLPSASTSASHGSV